MGRHFIQRETKGFTIIETMLVLAITGLLVAGLLVGLGSSIGIQRYKDAVVTFKNQIQSQYSQIDNVTNGRDSSWTCGSTATPIQGSQGKQPGQTDCFLIGRYMAIDGANVTTASVVGFGTPDTIGANDVETIKDNYTLGIAKDTIEESTLEWGATIGWPTKGPGSRPAGTPRAISILILRSPNSGTSYTFTSDVVTPIASVSSQTLLNMMVVGAFIPGQHLRMMCINPNGVTAPEIMAIYIRESANGPSSIESRTNDTTDTVEANIAEEMRQKC